MWKAVQGVLGSVAVIAMTLWIETIFPLGDWRWGVIALGCVVVLGLLHFMRRPSLPAPAPPAPAERQAWEIPGARRDEYPIYEAACLLTDEPVTWPLSPRAQDEYDAIMVWRPPVTVHGSPDTQRAAVVEWVQLNPDLRFNRITKEELRRYLRAASRALPAFLDKRFDW